MCHASIAIFVECEFSVKRSLNVWQVITSCKVSSRIQLYLKKVKISKIVAHQLQGYTRYETNSHRA